MANNYYSKPFPLVQQGQVMIPGKFVFHGDISSSVPTNTASTAHTDPALESYNGLLTDTEFSTWGLTAGDYLVARNVTDTEYYVGRVASGSDTAWTVEWLNGVPAFASTYVVDLALVVFWGIPVSTSATAGSAMQVLGAFTKRDAVQSTTYPRIANLKKNANIVAITYETVRGEYLIDSKFTLTTNGFYPAALLSSTTVATAASITNDFIRYQRIPTIDKGEKSVLDRLILIYTKKTSPLSGFQIKANNVALTLGGYTKIALPYNANAEYLASCFQLPHVGAKDIELLLSLETIDYFNSATISFIDSASLEQGQTILA